MYRYSTKTARTGESQIMRPGKTQKKNNNLKLFFIASRIASVTLAAFVTSELVMLSVMRIV